METSTATTAYVYFDSIWAPCAFLIVRDGADPYSPDPRDTVLVQTDWDYPGVASRMGWQACQCGETDGTVNCAHRKSLDMIAEASDYIRKHAEERFEGLADYFTD